MYDILFYGVYVAGWLLEREAAISHLLRLWLLVSGSIKRNSQSVRCIIKLLWFRIMILELSNNENQ